MLVSAISLNSNNAYNMSHNMPFYNIKNNEPIGDTAFNSLTPYTKKNTKEDDLSNVYDNINEWQNFCHKQIVGEKLNIIA